MRREDHGTHTEPDAERFEQAHNEDDDRPLHEQYEPGDER